MKLRPATFEDAGLLFAWRNDDLTRAMSLSTGEVSWADHESWLRGSLVNPDRKLLICENDNGPVGTVRIDEGTEVSWTVAPEHRRKGIGSQMVSMASPDHAVAWIKAENEASRRIAEKAGFVLASDGELQKWVRS